MNDPLEHQPHPIDVLLLFKPLQVSVPFPKS